MGLFGKKEDPEDLMYQAMTFLEKNQPKAAVSLLKKVTKIDPENVNAWYNQGLALNQLKKYPDAITCFDIIVQMNPNDASALNNRAIAMAELGDQKEQWNIMKKQSR